MTSSSPKTTGAGGAVNPAIVGTIDYDDVLRLVVERTAELTRADACLLLLTGTDQRARVVAFSGFDAERVRGFSAPLDERIGPALHELLGLGDEDVFSGTPVVRRGRVEGILVTLRRGPSATAVEDERLLSALADQAAIALHHAERFRQVREDLRVREALMEQVYAQSPVGIFVLRADLVIEDMNAAGGQMLGTTPEGGAGKRLDEALGEGGAAIRPLVERALGGEQVAVSEVRIPRPGAEGETFWDARFVALPDETGKPSLVLGTLWEVTDRVRAMEHQRALAHTGRLFGGYHDHAARLAAFVESVVPCLADVCLVDVVEQGALRRIAGSGVPSRGSGPASSATASNELGDVGSLLEEGEPELYPDQAATHGEARTPRFVEWGAHSYICVPLRTGDEVVGIFSLVRTQPGRPYQRADLDLAEAIAGRVAPAIDNARLYAEAQAAIKMRDDVFSVVSHDLKNLMSPMAMNASAIARASSAPERDEWTRRSADVVLRSVQRMLRLIDDLSDLASIHAGRLTVRPEVHEVASLIDETIDLHAVVAQPKAIRLTAEVHPAARRVLADRERVLQVLSNLVGDAIQFSVQGACIAISTEPVQGGVRMAVSDNGPGIAPEALPHVFDPYWRGASSGSGLGLYVARGIVKAHGGRIWAESKVGVGTTFYFTLPAPPEAPENAPVP